MEKFPNASGSKNPIQKHLETEKIIEINLNLTNSKTESDFDEEKALSIKKSEIQKAILDFNDTLFWHFTY